MNKHFRGKRLDNGEWVYGYHFFKHEVSKKGITNQHFITWTNKHIQMETAQVDPRTIGMFTGLEDVERNKIYEGDVFIPLGDDINDYQIIFRHGCFGYEVVHDFIPLGRNHHFFDLTEKFMPQAHRSDKIIIIGNVHDHPELIDQRSDS